MSNKLWTPLLIALVLGATSANAAKLYKWTDEKGNIHYSEAAPTKEELTGSQDAEPEITAEPVDETPVIIPEPTDLAASQQAAQLCQGLLHDLEQYNSGESITGNDGSVMLVSPEMREVKIAEINAQLDQSCR